MIISFNSFPLEKDHQDIYGLILDLYSLRLAKTLALLISYKLVQFKRLIKTLKMETNNSINN
jgi:hypothetical protein